MDFIKFVNRRM